MQKPNCRRFLRKFAGDKAVIYSAGIETHGVNPRAISTMKEIGIDIGGHTSNNIDENRDIPFDFVITVCDNTKERCPYFPTKAKKFYHNLSDSAKTIGTEDEISESFRSVRELIETYCEEFIRTNL